MPSMDSKVGNNHIFSPPSFNTWSVSGEACWRKERRSLGVDNIVVVLLLLVLLLLLLVLLLLLLTVFVSFALADSDVLGLFSDALKARHILRGKRSVYIIYNSKK